MHMHTHNTYSSLPPPQKDNVENVETCERHIHSYIVAATPLLEYKKKVNWISLSLCTCNSCHLHINENVRVHFANIILFYIRQSSANFCLQLYPTDLQLHITHIVKFYKKSV